MYCEIIASQKVLMNRKKAVLLTFAEGDASGGDVTRRHESAIERTRNQLFKHRLNLCVGDGAGDGSLEVDLRAVVIAS